MTAASSGFKTVPRAAGTTCTGVPASIGCGNPTKATRAERTDIGSFGVVFCVQCMRKGFNGSKLSDRRPCPLRRMPRPLMVTGERMNAASQSLRTPRIGSETPQYQKSLDPREQ
jgi:hypothetical protein